MNLANPIQLIVPIKSLKQTKKFSFNHECSSTELYKLEKILDVLKIESVSFKGQLTPSDSQNYKLHASFKATVTQACVITLKPVTTQIEQQIHQHYSTDKEAHQAKTVSGDYKTTEIERIFNEVNIGDLILEFLSLSIPLYPKNKNASFEGISATKSGIKPLEKPLNNPFNSLKKLI